MFQVPSAYKKARHFDFESCLLCFTFLLNSYRGRCTFFHLCLFCLNLSQYNMIPVMTLIFTRKIGSRQIVVTLLRKFCSVHRNHQKKSFHGNSIERGGSSQHTMSGYPAIRKKKNFGFVEINFLGNIIKIWNVTKTSICYEALWMTYKKVDSGEKSDRK